MPSGPGMSMTPQRAEPDEDSYYDLLIEQELERINLEDEEEEDLVEDAGQEDEEGPVDESMPAAMESYLKRIREQNELFEEELKEVDELIQHQTPQSGKESVALVPVMETELLRLAAAEHGLDPETYRKQILTQLDQDDDSLSLEEEELTADSYHSNSIEMGGGEPGVLLTEVTVDRGADDHGGSVGYTRQGHGLTDQGSTSAHTDASHSQEGSFKDECDAIVLADPSCQFRQFLRDQWYETAEKQRHREALVREKSELSRREIEKLEEDMSSRRQERRAEFSVEEQQLAEINATKAAKLEEDLAQKQKKMEKELRQYQLSIEELEKKTDEERKALQTQQELERERKGREMELAAVRIQAVYRGYRVKKVHADELNVRRQRRNVEIEEKKIKEKEIELQQLKEEREREEAERRQQEEIKQKEEQLRKEEEDQLRREKEEQLQKEKEQQLKKEKEERLRVEREEQLRKEKEEQLRKEKEEQLRKEKEEQLKKEREEQLRKTKEEQLRKEETERVRKEKEEQLRKEKEEQLRKEEEEQLRKEKEEQLRKEKEEQLRKDKEEQLRKEKEEQLQIEKEEQLKTEKEGRLRKEREDKMRKEKDTPCPTEGKNETDPSGLLLGSLSEDVEKRRRDWMKDCVSWSKISNEPWKTKSKSSRKLVKRPSSSKRLPPLREELILTAARANSLQQVTTVQLSDLPGCSLSTLGQCVHLQYLRLTGCGVRAVDGLTSCKELRYIDLQNNEVQYVDLGDLEKLEYLNLSSNQLSVIHGVDGCSNLRWLDLSNNKVIKLGSLSGLRRLHTLRLAHNQLVSTQGLGEVPTLQSLNLAHNHLQSVEDMDKLCLLQSLILTGNNILQLPFLSNHVLLQNLQLEDNSITSLDNLLLSWLPCLRQLNVAQNSISNVGVVSPCLVLQELDISNNQLLDGEEMLRSLACCRHLEKLCWEGNPVGEEATFVSRATSQFPRLSFVNNQSTHRSHPPTTLTPQSSFEATCLAQSQAVQQVWDAYHQNITSTSACDLAGACSIHSAMCGSSFDLAVEHRYAHEYGEVLVNWPAAPSKPKPTDRPTRCRVSDSTKPKRATNVPTAVTDSNGVQGTVSEGRSSRATGEVTPESVCNSVSPAEGGGSGLRPMTDSTATEAWSGYPDSDITSSTRVSGLSDRSELWAAERIQAAWKGYKARQLYSQQRDSCPQSGLTHSWTNQDEAATKIQALWRGYSLRSRLLMALEYAHLEEEEEEFAEIDLEDFSMDMADLDADWKPPPTPKIPSSHALLGKPPSGRLVGPHASTSGADLPAPHPPAFPRQAWRNLTSPLTNRSSPQARPRPPSSQASGTDTHRTGLSKKEELLSEEWGFKDNRTAELMLQRAKKMKYNADKKKKLSKLDPKQKLALFKKLSESTKLLHPVQHPTRKVLPRKEYFQARAREAEQKDRDKRSEVVTRASRTFEWLHTQVGEFPTSDPAKVLIRSESDTGLPRLDEEITAGRRVQLVASPAPLDLESVSSMGEQRLRSFSMDDSSPLGVQQMPLQLPPIKTNSAPSSHVKERMSWRTRQKNADVGWGGGRKRSMKS